MKIPPAEDRELIFEAIAEGVDRAMWRMITNGTQMPCNDFFATIKEAVNEAMERVVDKVAP